MAGTDASIGNVRELLIRVRDGDGAAFDEIYSRYHQFVFSTFLGLGFSYDESWDLMQESFLHALRGLTTLDLERPVYFGGWLSTIARNVARRAAQRAGRRLELAVEDSELYAFPDLGGSPRPNSEDGARRHAALYACLAGLEPQLRAIVITRVLFEYSFRTIAPLVGCAEATVRNRLAEARTRLRMCLEDKGVTEAE